MSSTTGEPTVIDLMLFHTTERQLYSRLTRRLGCNPELMKSVLALWLWMESIGYYDFIRHVYAFGDDIVMRFTLEARLCLDALANPGNVTDDNYDDIPLTAYQVNEPMDLRFFVFNRDLAIGGIGRIYFTVCRIIFDADLMREAEQVVASWEENPQAPRPVLPPLPPAPAVAGGGTPGFFLLGQRSSHIFAPPMTRALPPPPPPRDSTLNPLARPYCPATGHSPDDQRSMFITFSKGHPISRDDITEFFNSRYGHCVESVMIERAPPGVPPMYGRVIFTTPSMIAIVLNGQRTAKFMIKGKHLWARMYVPRHGGGGGSSGSGGGASSGGGGSGNTI